MLQLAADYEREAVRAEAFEIQETKTDKSSLPAPAVFFCGASNLSLHTAANISAKFYGRLFREVAGHTLEGPQVVARLV